MATTPATAAPSRFVRIARACNRHRRITVLVWVVTVVVIQLIASAVGKQEISSFRLPGTESQRAYDLLAEHFPAQKGDTDQIVFRARSGTLRDPAQRAAIAAALAKVSKAPDVASVADPFSLGGRITPDGRIGLATLTYTKSTNDIKPKQLEKAEKAMFTARSKTLQVEHGGQGAEIVRFSHSSGPSAGLGFFAAAIVLLFTFGSALAAGIPLLSAALAIGSALGLITLLSHVVDTPDFASQLAELIGVGVGIDYALFVLTRYRAEVAGGATRDEAIETAADTAGRTVMFAAATVIIALLGLLVLGLSFMHGVALGAASAVLATMIAALTLLPATIGGSGPFVDGVLRELDRRGGLRLPFRQARHRIPGSNWRMRRAAKVKPSGDGARWARWAAGVQRRPWLAVGLSLTVLIGLALPALNLRLGSSDAGVDPPGTTTRAAYRLIADGFGAGTNGAFLLVVKTPKPGDKAAAQQVAAAVAKDGAFTKVTPPILAPDGKVATITAYPRTGPQAVETTDTLKRVRHKVIPPVEQATGASVAVGGYTASTDDFSHVVASKLPLFVGVVVLLSALLLMAVFRSVIIPVKAAVMNLLSIGAALGFVTLIFQDGHGAGLLGIGTGPIESFVPVLMFAIVFGLSMDYEVFLLSRVHEDWEHTGDASGAVRRGLANTGRVITAAASIMIVVFASFAIGDDRIIKLFGLGLASAVFLDAVIIRCLLVPALMEIFGARAWWLPASLDRWLPRLAIERAETPPPAPPRVPAAESA